MKKTTIDDLAIMVAEGFAQTASKTDLKVGLDGLEERLTKRIDGIDQRLQTVESLLSSNRIEKLEDDMRRVKTILKVK